MNSDTGPNPQLNFIPEAQLRPVAPVPAAPTGTHEKVRRTITWYRAPISTTGVLIVVLFMHQMNAFWWGLPVALAGEMLQVWAASQLRKDQLFTISGPYSHVRNPMYIGRFIMVLGFFIMTGQPLLIAIYALLYGVYAHVRVQREERRLSHIFAPHYQHYCTEIRRWLPRLKPYSRATSRRATWAQVCANGEQLILAGVLLVLVLIYFRIKLLPFHL